MRRVVSQPTFRDRGTSRRRFRPRFVGSQTTKCRRGMLARGFDPKTLASSQHPRAPRRLTGRPGLEVPFAAKRTRPQASSRIVRVSQSRFGGQDRIGERQRCGAGPRNPLRSGGRRQRQTTSGNGTVAPERARRRIAAARRGGPALRPASGLPVRAPPQYPPQPRSCDDRPEDRPDRQPAHEVGGRRVVLAATQVGRPGVGPSTAITDTMAIPTQATIDAPSKW